MWPFTRKQPAHNPDDYAGLTLDHGLDEPSWTPSYAPASSTSRFISVHEGARRLAAIAPKGKATEDIMYLPIVKLYMQEHPHTRQDPICIQIAYRQAYAQAEREMAEDDATYGKRELTERQRELLLERRARDLTWFASETVDLEALEFDKQMETYENRRALLRQIEEVREAVDRSAVAANIIDFAREHPVIAAVAGVSALDVIKKSIR